MRKTEKRCLWVVVMAILCAAPVMAELTFVQTYDAGVGAGGTLRGNATVSGGQLNVPKPDADAAAQYVLPTSSVLDWTAGSWGSNTVCGIITVSNPGTRQTFLSIGKVNGDSDKEGLELLYLNRGDMALWTYYGINGEVRNTMGNSVPWLADGVNMVPSGVKTFVAASWMQTEEGDVKTTMYIRPLTGEGLAYYSAGFTDGTVGKGIGAPSAAILTDVQITVGSRVSGGAGGGNPKDQLGGSVDLVQIYKGEYLNNVAACEALYTSVVPEPATMALLGLGSLMMYRRKK